MHFDSEGRDGMIQQDTGIKMPIRTVGEQLEALGIHTTEPMKKSV